MDSRELGNRLGAAEKAVEKFVSKRIQPAVQKVSNFQASELVDPRAYTSNVLKTIGGISALAPPAECQLQQLLALLLRLNNLETRMSLSLCFNSNLQAVKTPVRRWAAGVRTGADYIQGVWVRLNGGGRRLAGIAGLPQGLQMPPVNKEARAAATKALSLEISSLEKRLQESSKVSLRKSTVRQAFFQLVGHMM